MDEHFPVNNPELRSVMRKAAEHRAQELTSKTGYDHDFRWDLVNAGYIVFEKPMEVPTKQWTWEYAPRRRSPDYDKFPTRFVPFDDLLIEASKLGMLQWVSAKNVPPNPNQFRDDLQTALDDQYGRGHFWAYRHGSWISIQCRFPLNRCKEQ